MNEDKQFRELLARHFVERLQKAAGDEAAYLAALEEKAAAMRQAASPDGAALRALEERLSVLEAHGRELVQAIDAAQLARATVHDIINDLDRVRPYVMPPNHIVHMERKWALLRGLQVQSNRLQRELGRLRGELADIHFRFDHRAEVGKIVRTSNVLLDLLCADEAALGRVLEERRRMLELLNPLEELTEALEQASREGCVEQEEIALWRRTLIERSRIFPAGDEPI